MRRRANDEGSGIEWNERKKEADGDEKKKIDKKKTGLQF